MAALGPEGVAAEGVAGAAEEPPREEEEGEGVGVEEGEGRKEEEEEEEASLSAAVVPEVLDGEGLVLDVLNRELSARPCACS